MRVYSVLDNLAAHRAPDVLPWALTPPRWEFVFQPKYAAYLNLIEPWWKVLRSLALKGRRMPRHGGHGALGRSPRRDAVATGGPRRNAARGTDCASGVVERRRGGRQSVPPPGPSAARPEARR